MDVHCSKCEESGKSNDLRIDCTGGAKLRGIITCTYCQHEMPFTMSKGHVQELSIALPGEQSSMLNKEVPLDIKEDIKEAERANYAQCYKACATMCRRALQLSLIDKEIEDGPLGQMLAQANARELFNSTTYSLASSIKYYGDIGVHRTTPLDPRDINMLLHATVRMINELFPSNALQS